MMEMEGRDANVPWAPAKDVAGSCIALLAARLYMSTAILMSMSMSTNYWIII